MGLDMFLSARRYTSEYFEKEINQQLISLADKFLPASSENSITISRDVVYWRKANQIHNWFVVNVQGGEDNCGTYTVSIEQLKSLREICVQVQNSSQMQKGKVTNGYRYTADEGKQPIIENGEVIIDTTLAEELLPTVSGFFFGSTNYDSYYMNNIVRTIEQLDKILEWCAIETNNGDSVEFEYRSSW